MSTPRAAWSISRGPCGCRGSCCSGPTSLGFFGYPQNANLAPKRLRRLLVADPGLVGRLRPGLRAAHLHDRARGRGGGRGAAAGGGGAAADHCAGRRLAEARWRTGAAATLAAAVARLAVARPRDGGAARGDRRCWPPAWPRRASPRPSRGCWCRRRCSRRRGPMARWPGRRRAAAAGGAGGDPGRGGRFPRRHRRDRRPAAAAGPGGRRRALPHRRAGRRGLAW